VRLSHCFVTAVFAEVSGLSFACFPFGPGLRAYGAGLSWGFQTHSMGMKDEAEALQNCKFHRLMMMTG